jgi:hypothetical protein
VIWGSSGSSNMRQVHITGMWQVNPMQQQALEALQHLYAHTKRSPTQALAP